MRDIDPLIEALEPVVLLSGNPECHSSLLAYLCLPKASGQLIGLAHMDAGSSLINNHIAVLIGNLFNVSKMLEVQYTFLLATPPFSPLLHFRLDVHILLSVVGTSKTFLYHTYGQGVLISLIQFGNIETLLDCIFQTMFVIVFLVLFTYTCFTIFMESIYV